MIPHRILVGPFTYHFDDRVNDDDDGDTDTAKLRISISQSLAPMRQREVVLHEVMHATYSAFAPAANVSDKAEEAVISVLAPALLLTLRDNAELVSFLLREE